MYNNETSKWEVVALMEANQVSRGLPELAPLLSQQSIFQHTLAERECGFQSTHWQSFTLLNFNLPFLHHLQS